jgi:Protein of unknown function (DUF3987)
MTVKRKTIRSKKQPAKQVRKLAKRIRTTAPATNTKIVFNWEAPDESLLEDRRGTLPQFPCDVFPPGLSDWLARASRGAGTLIDHIAVPMLGVTSSLIGKARRVQANTSWIEPMTLWTCVVGESGNRKTPGLKVITRALDKIEEDNKPIYTAKSMAHLARVENARAEMKHWRKECEEAVNKKREPPPMPIEAFDPGEFIWPALYVTDCTVIRLGKLCTIRPRGLIQIRDELAGLFASAKQLSQSRSFYLQAWDGNKFVVERVDDDRTFTVDNLLIGVIGGFQPDRLARAFEGDQDGMYGRFLYGWPETPAYNPLTDEISEIDPVFQNLLTKLIRLPDNNEHNEFAPLTIPLSTEARNEFEKYRIFAYQEGCGIEGREHQWLSKSETHLLRLAGTLAYLSWADGSTQQGDDPIKAALEPSEINQQSMVNAVRLMRDYFWPHARAALRQIGLTKHRSLIVGLLRGRGFGRRQQSEQH